MQKDHGGQDDKHGYVPNELLIDAKRARVVLGNISARKLWQMTAEFELPCVRMGRRVMYSTEALRKWIADNTEGGQQ